MSTIDSQQSNVSADGLESGGTGDLPAEGSQAPSPDARPAAHAARSRTRRWLMSLLPGLFSFTGGFALWEVFARAEIVNPLFLPRFSQVMESLYSTITGGDFERHAWASSQPLLIGLALTIAFGVPSGMLLGRLHLLERIFGPWLIAIHSVPRIAFIPMLIVFFGLGQTSKVAVVFIASVFPLIINTAAGAKNVEPQLLQMAESFNVTKLHTLRRVTVPATVPFMLAGFRISVAQSLIGVVVAELFASNAGVGHLLFLAANVYDTPMVYAMILVLGTAGVVLSQGALYLERMFESWRI